MTVANRHTQHATMIATITFTPKLYKGNVYIKTSPDTIEQVIDWYYTRIREGIIKYIYPTATVMDISKKPNNMLAIKMNVARVKNLNNDCYRMAFAELIADPDDDRNYPLKIGNTTYGVANKGKVSLKIETYK